MATGSFLPVLIGLALLHSSLGIPQNVVFECPKDPVPSPCECDKVFGKVVFKCTFLKNRTQLIDSFAAMKGHAVDLFEIEDSIISDIPHNLFRYSSVDKIRIKETKMFYLFDQELEHASDSVIEVKLDSVEFEGGLDWSVMENLENLQVLSVNDCDLEQIAPMMTEVDIPLESLFLSNNDIESIYDEAFKNLKSLKNLKLDHNQVKELKRSMFPLPNSELQFLDLGYNSLSTLPADMFDGFPKLHSVILRNNAFTTLEKSYMKKIFASLFVFNVSENPLKCGCELSWVLSEKKPYHFFGQCTEEGTSKVKQLNELESSDFQKC